MVLHRLNQLLEDIGMGNRPAGLVLRRLFPADPEADEAKTRRSGFRAAAISHSGHRGNGGVLW